MMASTLAAGTFLAAAVALSLAGSAPAQPGTQTAANPPAVVVQQGPFLHPLFSDNMVLQRDVAAPVWGWSKPGARVTVAMGGKTARAIAGTDGKWLAHLGPFSAGGPFTLEVKSGPRDVRLRNVLVGDVWLCSGQSNMEMGMSLVNNGAQEIAAANDPQLRLLTVPHNVSVEAHDTFAAQWQPCTPQSVGSGGWGGFSAAAYFFGREVRRRTGVPIGLIHTSWGGTPIEAWMSEGTLAASGDFNDALSTLAAARDPRYREQQESAMEAWYRANDPGSAANADANAQPLWAVDALDDAAWPLLNAPGVWEQAGVAGLENFDGVLWYRHEFDVPAEAAGQSAVLKLQVDDNDAAWVNGVAVGATQGVAVARAYPVPAGVLRAGRNVVAVRVLDTGGAGGIISGPALEMAGGQSVNLAGQWRFHTGVELRAAPPLPRDLNTDQNFPSVLFNGMVAPLQGFAVKGALWYQGESNAGRAAQYARLLPAMIADWRTRFPSSTKGGFPFYIVQLANFGALEDGIGAWDWAELREVQAHVAATIPNTALASAIDIGEAGDIHPRNKQEVGRRLALDALAGTYGQKVEASGPVFAALQTAPGTLRVSFNHAQGLHFTGDRLLGFAIAGADGHFVEADARLGLDGHSVVLSAPGVLAPVTARYGWANNPICNLYNGAGLPATPFRTDSPFSNTSVTAPPAG